MKTIELTDEEATVLDVVLDTVEQCFSTMGLDEWTCDDSVAGGEELIENIHRKLSGEDA